MKKRTGLCIIILCLALLFPGPDPAFGQKLPEMPWSVFPVPMYKEETYCLNGLRNAVRELAQKDFPGSNPSAVSISILAMNDLSCETPEYMANVVITVMLEPTKTASARFLYGIFHVHFSGGLISAAALPPRWQGYSEADGWREGWCDFIRSVYSKELKEQGCN